MNYQLVRTRYLRFIKKAFTLNIFLSSLLTCITERRCDKIPILINKQLTNTYLMTFATIYKTTMVNQESITILIHKYRIMSLSQFPLIICAPCTHCAKNTSTTLITTSTKVLHIRRIYRIIIRTINALRTEYTHFISSRRSKTTIRKE